MLVKPETATVYKAPNGRRYLTRHGAYRSIARKMILDRCECQPAEHDVGYYGEICKYHSLDGYGMRVERRLARHLAYNDRRTA